MDVGDSFKIKKEYLDKGVKCKYQSKVFTIYRLSKSRYSIFYTDRRTNNDCFCNWCNIEGKEIILDVGVIRVISPQFITIVETRLQRERNLKLKSLNI